MFFNEYVNGGKPKIVLIHGMGCLWDRSFQHSIDMLKERYTIIVPRLDGHNNDETEFISIEHTSKQICDYLKEKYNNEVYAIFGMSMGGIIAIDMITHYDLKCSKLIVDGGYLHMCKAFSKFYIWVTQIMCRKILRNKVTRFDAFLIKFFIGYETKSDEFVTFFSKTSLYNCLKACFNYRITGAIEKLKNFNFFFWYGSKERVFVKSMKKLKKKFTNMKEKCFMNVGHGEVMANNPIFYTNELTKDLESDQEYYQVNLKEICEIK